MHVCMCVCMCMCDRGGVDSLALAGPLCLVIRQYVFSNLDFPKSITRNRC